MLNLAPVTTEKSVDDIISEIQFSLTTSRDGQFIYVNDLEEGETLGIYGPEDSEAACKHYESLLTEGQIEALKIRSELDYELMLEAQGNREIAGQW